DYCTLADHAPSFIVSVRRILANLQNLDLGYLLGFFINDVCKLCGLEGGLDVTPTCPSGNDLSSTHHGFIWISVNLKLTSSSHGDLPSASQFAAREVLYRFSHSSAVGIFPL